MKNLPQEVKIQEDIIAKLDLLNIYPYSVFFTYITNDGLLSITLFDKEDITKLLNVLNYNELCDKSGITIFEKTNTIVLTGIALLNMYCL